MCEYIVSFDIQEEIMKRLPVESLIRCRCISKAWKLLIDDTQFITAHSHHRHTHPHHLLVSYTGSDDYGRFLSYIDDDTFPQQRSVTVPLSAKRLCSLSVVGSSHGLICVRGYDPSIEKHTVVLWNPSIRKSVVVPVSESFPIYFGFGVCPVTCDPKLLSIKNQIGGEGKVATVYSLRSKIWRSTTVPDGNWCQTITTTRFIYSHPVDKKIVSFNLTRETFQAIDLPDGLASHRQKSDFCFMSKLRESLVLIRYVLGKHMFGATCGVWMLQDDGAQRSFIKLMEIETQSSCDRILEFRNDGMPIMLLAKGDDDDIVADDDDEPPSLVVIDPNSDGTAVIETIEIDGLEYDTNVHSYTKTLLLLHCNSD